MQNKSKIYKLSEQIKEAQNAYYNGSEIISDDEYDALIYELTCFDPSNQLLSKVGSDPSEQWVKEKHLHSLGSLNKVNFPNEMTKWIEETLCGKDVIVLDKLDGLSIGCQYTDGKLTKAVLRGNGLEGENILRNVVKMKGVIKKLTSDFSGTIRGEIILTKTDHQAHFPTYSNPRNAASGLCRRLDGEGSEYLTLIVYDVIGNDLLQLETDKIKFLQQNRFILPNYKVCKKASDVNDLWQQYQNTIRDSLDYEIDGLVVSCNDIFFQQFLGETNMRPKGKIAFKFANQFIKTTVTKIEYQVGNSGRITPVCWFEQVLLLGSKIEKASVYNMSYINEHKLDVGADVLVCKANEVIPRIEKVIKQTGTVAKQPYFCPVCNSVLKMNGENLQCVNVDRCSAQIKGRIKNWVSELNILELGDTLMEKLVDSGFVKDVSDLYKLSVDDLCKIERMAEKSAENVYNSIWKNTELPLDQLIGSLSIPMVATSTAKLVVDAGYDNFDKIYSLSHNDLENIKGMGEIKAKSFVDGIKKNKDLINKLLLNGIKIKEKIVGKLTGISVCFTGSMVNKRPILEQMVIDAGGTVKGSVGKGLNILVIADVNSASSKAVSARRLGTKLISENEFIEILS